MEKKKVEEKNLKKKNSERKNIEEKKTEEKKTQEKSTEKKIIVEKNVDKNDVKKKKKTVQTFRTAEVVTLVLITCVVSLLMGIIIKNPYKQQINVPEDKELQEFLEQYNYIIDNYYGTMDKKRMFEAALAGIVNALDDPYSRYIDEDELSSFTSELNGFYEGIGIEVINNDDNDIEIYTVFEDTPAYNAGLKVSDVIVSLNGQNVMGWSISSFVQLVKGMGDDSFTLKIKRGTETKEVTVTRAGITLKSVSSEIINEGDKKIGYISVSVFALNTDYQFKTALENLEKNNIDSLIIDLRGNNGGHLSSVENMISVFLDDKNVIYQIDDKTKTTKHYSSGKETKTYPIVVLIDEGSASASEMMASALKESYGATLVGKKTFGKGTVQELLNSKNSKYKITTKRWLTPKGNWINDIGVSPDVEVEVDEKYYTNPTKENDKQLQKALEIAKK